MVVCLCCGFSEIKKGKRGKIGADKAEPLEILANLERELRGKVLYVFTEIILVSVSVKKKRDENVDLMILLLSRIGCSVNNFRLIQGEELSQENCLSIFRITLPKMNT